MTSVVLFTRDLRVHDHPPLAEAAAAGPVVPLFVLDDRLLTSRYATANRVALLLEGLRDLDRSLEDRGGRLVIRRGDPIAEVVATCRQVGATTVHVADDVSAWARRRQLRLREALAGDGIELVVHPGHTVVEPGAVSATGRDHYLVFTPYHRAWAAAPRRDVVAPPARVEVPAAAGGLASLPRWQDLVAGERSPEPLPGGEQQARRLLRRWADGAVDGYDEGRDDLAVEATSRLSPHLHLGTISATELAAAADARAGRGAAAFTRQLAWRDFTHQLLAAHPRLAIDDLRPRGDRWRDDPHALRAWQEGRTGFPLVDAGMRQLRAQGWMHNRARMVAASLLTKTLRIDWRHGHAWFQRWLLDASVAQNAANWQWVAGTGTDSRPNRIYNPTRQGERHDPAGAYVRRWVPELADVPDRLVHHPWELRGTLLAPDYPPPLVDLAAARERFLTERAA